MAEPISGIITLISASLVLIRETKKFIQETREIDNELKRRSDQLEALEHCVLVVEQQCNSGIDLGKDLPRLMSDCLLNLKPKLEELQKIIRDQVARGSDTLYKRLKTQIYMRLSERDVKNAMEELANHRSIMTLFVQLSIFQVTTNIDRRQSQSSPTEASPTFPRPLLTTDLSPSNIVRRNPSVATESSFRSEKSFSSSLWRNPSEDCTRSPLEFPLYIQKEEDNFLDLHYYIIQAEDSQSRMRVVKKVLDSRSDRKAIVEKRDRYGRTPLFTAVKTGDLQLVRTLVLEFGADINAVDKGPRSVLEYTLSLPKRKFDPLVEFLIEQGVDQNNITSNEHRLALSEIIGSIELREQTKKRKKKEPKQKPSQTTNKRFAFGSKRRLPP